MYALEQMQYDESQLLSVVQIIVLCVNTLNLATARAISEGNQCMFKKQYTVHLQETRNVQAAVETE